MLRPVFYHCSPDQDYDLRFDTVMMVNGSIAALNHVASSLLGYPGVSIDETYSGAVLSGTERTAARLIAVNTITEYLNQGDEPIIFFTVLSYNAESTLTFIRKLRQTFGKRLRIGVGGQLIRTCVEAYQRNPDIDHIGVGDAEVVLAPLLLGQSWFEEGYLKIPEQGHYAPPCYDNYVGLSDRLHEMSRFSFGPLRNVRQLVTESVRGCSWAYATNTVCDFCSLVGVDTRPNFKAFEEHLRIERELAEAYKLTWIFDVSNQWLPVMQPNAAKAWLTDYLAARQSFGAADIQRYVYLTTNSITHETAPLLRQAGVRIAYVGIDGWDRATKAALHKTQASVESMLDACRANDLFIRTSLVIGSGINQENLATLPEFTTWLTSSYGAQILSCGLFLEIILPGSPVWKRFESQARARGWRDATRLYDRFYAQGFLSWQDQSHLNELYVRLTRPNVDYTAVTAARDAAKAIVDAAPTTLGITIEDCQQLDGR